MAILEEISGKEVIMVYLVKLMGYVFMDKWISLP